MRDQMLRNRRPPMTIAIVIPVHGALDYLTQCLESWNTYTTNSFIYLVDDCDLVQERALLREIASTYDNVTVIENLGTASVGCVKTQMAAVNKQSHKH